MKHVVILNVGSGDEIQVVKIFDDGTGSMEYAKATAESFSKQFFDDMHSDWMTGVFGDPNNPDEEPEKEIPTENFQLLGNGHYQYTVRLNDLDHEWIVHGVDD